MMNFITLNDFLVLSGKYESDIDVFYNQLLGDFYKLFDGTEYNPYITNPPNTTLHKYFDTKMEFLQYLITKYGTRCFSEKFVYHEEIPKVTYDSGGHIIDIQLVYADDDDAYEAIKTYLLAALNTWVKSNTSRYVRMIGALEMDYNPIENYDKTEDTDNTPTGTHQRERKHDITRTPGSIEVTAPISDVSLDTDLKLSSVTPESKVEVFTKGEGVSTTDDRFGKTIGTVTLSDTTDAQGVRTITPTLTAGGAGTDRTNENQVTTYDSDTYHNNSKNTEKGDKANDARNAGYSASDDVGHVVVRKDKIDADYTDTESWTNYKNNTHTRGHGNIGVTTTQQLLEQELALRAKPVIHNIIDDVMDQVMLHVWE